MNYVEISFYDVETKENFQIKLSVMLYEHKAGLANAPPPGCHVICYADDILVLAGGEDWGEAHHNAEVALATVVGTISDLGLKVALQKTRAIYFHDGSRGAPPETQVLVDGVRVRVGSTIKYLDLTLNGRWDFRAHFRDLAPRVRKAGLALARLM
ncbi:uncharacterized protein LOC112590222 [Harpegnathos saltator]|uniref:uncharacterized protein LOC112590222 n=1 Tax=Harpegnathos saltator TaxID=610380 RepID=UPI000DBED5B5|nr:uncharacterized protein LOC112590222 [Harpegnathos saltator]